MDFMEEVLDQIEGESYRSKLSQATDKKVRRLMRSSRKKELEPSTSTRIEEVHLMKNYTRSIMINQKLLLHNEN